MDPDFEAILNHALSRFYEVTSCKPTLILVNEEAADSLYPGWRNTGPTSLTWSWPYHTTRIEVDRLQPYPISFLFDKFQVILSCNIPPETHNAS